MLTNEDVEKMREVFATKDDLISLKEMVATKDDINRLFTAVDGYAKKADAYFQEMVMMNQSMHRHEKWIMQLAEKLGVKLEY